MSSLGVKFYQAVTHNEIGGLQLSMEEAFPNAEAVFNFFCLNGGFLYNIPWESAAGIIGNMYIESRINPIVWQGYNERPPGGDPLTANESFGTLQWTPGKKLTQWAVKNGYDYNTIWGQCNRILYEYVTPLEQWFPTQLYPLTFEQYMTGDYEPLTAEMAARIWQSCYLRMTQGDDTTIFREYAARNWMRLFPEFRPLPPPMWLFRRQRRGIRRV